ncbi:MAG: dipeptidase [Clostridioides sp.]|jgi:membrane dipeptidase|nr:dipeptidase [Clostridioides sp.]
MKYIDLHCDTVYKMMEDTEKYGLRKNDFSIDVEKLAKGGCMAQMFALFLDQDENKNLYEYCIAMSDKINFEIEKNSDKIALATNYGEIIANDRAGKISALISIEEGGAIEGSLDKLDEFYDRDVRLMTLTWNHVNEIGYPHCREEYTNLGLTEFGKLTVERMNELGMIIDVSHLSDGGFYDVAKLSKKPFVASHSNSRAMRNVSRNLTDEMIKIVANSGGVTGINFADYFLGDYGDNFSRISDMIRHIKHIQKVGGVDVIALGSDFDGIGSEVEIRDASEMDKLYQALKLEGFKDGDIEKIFYKNALRVITDVLF